MSSILATLHALGAQQDTPAVAPKKAPPPVTPFAHAMQTIMQAHAKSAQQAHAQAQAKRANAIATDQFNARVNASKAQAQGALRDNAGFDPMAGMGRPSPGGQLV